MTTIPHVLICDDDKVLHATLGMYLEKAGFTYTSAYDGQEALEQVEKVKPDLVLLDIMMPKRNGIDVCKDIRSTSSVPIIMFTAKDEEIDKILGLELGADDYIVKTASNREVLARIKAVLRRQRNLLTLEDNIVRYKDLEINIANYDVKISGQSMGFTPKEVEIFHLLASNPGHVFNRSEILAKIWGADHNSDERVVDTQIKRIRHKIPDTITSWKIATVYGIGYRFDA